MGDNIFNIKSDYKCIFSLNIKRWNCYELEYIILRKNKKDVELLKWIEDESGELRRVKFVKILLRICKESEEVKEYIDRLKEFY